MQAHQNILFTIFVIICTGLVQHRSVAQTLEVTAANFGTVSIGDVSDVGFLIIRNTSTDSVTLRRLTLLDARQNFDIIGIIDDSTTFLPLSPNQSIRLPCRFFPRDIGALQVPLTISFTRGSAQQSQVVQNALVGRCTPLKLVPPKVDTVLVGYKTVKTALLLNRWINPVKVSRLQLVSPRGEIAFSDLLDPKILARGDTVPISIIINPQQTGSIDGTLLVYSELQDTLSVKIQVYARLRRADDIVIRPGIRAVPDSAAPGDTIRLEIYLSSESSSNEAILRASQPTFSGIFSLNGNLAQLLSTGDVRPIGQTLNNGRGVYNGGRRYFQMPLQRWDDRSSILYRIPMQAMAGDTDLTEIQLSQFQWGNQASSSSPNSNIFILPPLSGLLRIKTCTAGGKRLFTAAKTTTFALQSAFPNPADTHFEVAYTVNEKQNLSLSLYNARGNLVRSIKSALHEAGEYSERLETGFLATGTYFLRLSGETTIQQRVVNVIK